jgi:hypothetical protein
LQVVASRNTIFGSKRWPRMLNRHSAQKD